jgi:hypothetical protein
MERASPRTRQTPAMNPSKVIRNKVVKLTDLPNVGKAGAADLLLIGIHQPTDLIGQCPFEMYRRLCEVTGAIHDPCVIDVFMSITSFMDGGEPRVWWDFSADRKKRRNGRSDS